MKPKIYIFSIFNWDSELLHREHMLAKSFETLGYQVCFVERSYRKIFGPKNREEDNIKVYTVFGFPYLHGIFKLVFKANDWLIKKQLTKVLGSEEAWLILSSPLWAKSVYAVKTKEQKLVYDISDDYLAYATNNIWRNNLKEYEDYLIGKSERITITSNKLAEKIPKNKKHVVLENGVDLKSFATAKPILRKKFTGKIVGFIGGVYQRVDLNLVAECAKKYPKDNFVIIGPTDQQKLLTKLSKLSNFHYLGVIPWNQIQDYFASLDVGIIPFVSESNYRWLKAVDNMKAYQYAFFGYPIVATTFGHINDLEPMVGVAKTKDDFIRLVGEGLSENDSVLLRDKRMELAKNHDWLKIAENMASEINSDKL